MGLRSGGLNVLTKGRFCTDKTKGRAKFLSTRPLDFILRNYFCETITVRESASLL